jgi:hypothetical protein
MRRLLAALALCLSILCPVALPVAPAQSPPAQQDPKAQTVYITRTGKKYHRDGCLYLAASKIEISLKDAKVNGYTACIRARISAGLLEYHADQQPPLDDGSASYVHSA